MMSSPIYTSSHVKMAVIELCRKFGYKDWLVVYHKIVKAYAKPRRYYHTLNGHIEKCLGVLQKLQGHIEDLDAVMAELLLHDGIMEFGSPDNDDRSAEWASKLLAEIGAPEKFCFKVATGILNHKHTEIPNSQDGCFGVDIDLIIMGAPHWEWVRCEKNIRQESALVLEEVFRARRAKILKRFLARPSIYTTEYFRKKYEIQAGRNLKWSILKLSGK